MNDIQSLVFYILSLLLSGIFYCLYNKKNKKVFLILSFIIPVLISGLRYNTGADYKTYINMYNNTYSGKEPGFTVIAFVSRFLGGQNVVFIIYSLLTQFFIYAKLKNTPKERRSYIYFYYLFLLFPSSMNIMRQSLAMSIIFYAEKYIESNNSKKWIAFILLATCVHIPAIVILPFFYLIKIKNKYIKFTLLFILAIISINIPEILILIQTTMHINITYIDQYAKPYPNPINNKMFYVNIVFLIYALVSRKLSKEKSDNARHIQLYAFLYYMALSLGAFRNPYIGRLGGYLETSKLELLADGPTLIKGGGREIRQTCTLCARHCLFRNTGLYLKARRNNTI